MEKYKKLLISLLVFIFFIGACVAITGYKNKALTNSSYADGWVAYANPEDQYNLYIKNQKTGENKIILNESIRNACRVNQWVYYFRADFEGIFKIKIDGTENTKVCSIDTMGSLNNNMGILSEYADGAITYTVKQLREVGDNNIYPDRHYLLNIKKNTLEEK